MPSTKLERFEQLIVDRMAERFCNKATAEKIVQRYLPVIRELKDDHDSATIQAERFFNASQKGIDPDAWVMHIKRTNAKYGIGPSPSQGTEVQAPLTLQQRAQKLLEEAVVIPGHIIRTATWRDRVASKHEIGTIRTGAKSSGSSKYGVVPRIELHVSPGGSLMQRDPTTGELTPINAKVLNKARRTAQKKQ